MGASAPDFAAGRMYVPQADAISEIVITWRYKRQRFSASMVFRESRKVAKYSIRNLSWITIPVRSIGNSVEED